MSNNTPDPVALAREVLDMAHEDETVTVCTIPDNKVAALARAVIDTADALDDLGDLLDDASTWGPDDEERMLPQLHTIRARIRTALNGDAQ